MKGLNSVPPEPTGRTVQVLFQTWHLMIGVGMLLALIMVIGLWLLVAKAGASIRSPILKTLRLAVPLPIIACLLGWMTTEIGRQPWIVQGQLRTSDAVSTTVSTGDVATTLAIFVALYAVLFFVWLHVVRKIVRKGPADLAGAGLDTYVVAGDE